MPEEVLAGEMAVPDARSLAGGRESIAVWVECLPGAWKWAFDPAGALPWLWGATTLAGLPGATRSGQQVLPLPHAVGPDCSPCLAT